MNRKTENQIEEQKDEKKESQIDIKMTILLKQESWNLTYPTYFKLNLAQTNVA